MSESVSGANNKYTSAVNHSDLSKVKAKHGPKEDKTKLEMEDFLNLMVVTLQNQTIDSTVDTADMMNQMVQMSVIQTLGDMSTLIEDSTTMTYAASLVGKNVTIGQWVGDKLNETSGTVVGTGTLNNEQVIFLEGDSNAYKLTDIMGVGTLPEKITVPGEETDKTENDTEQPGTDTPVENPSAPEGGGNQNQSGTEQTTGIPSV